jgi:hypothetical protein
MEAVMVGAEVAAAPVVTDCDFREIDLGADHRYETITTIRNRYNIRSNKEFGMRTFACVSLACLLAGCTTPPPKPAVVSANDKPACDLPETGSHMVDRHSSCNRSNVQVMGADATATALRQANPGAISSH